MSRINWTQTTTITVAAFIGCLAALAVLFFVYQSFLSKAIRERMAKLDRLDRQIDGSQHELSQLTTRKPLVSPPPGERETEPAKAEPVVKTEPVTPKAETPTEKKIDLIPAV